MRTVRTADGAAVYAHPGTQMVWLARLGLVHKVAVGYYVVVPREHVGTDWRPTNEAAAAGGCDGGDQAPHGAHAAAA
jgi:hypothetical protein